MYYLTLLLVYGGLADALGWICAGGMILGVVLGNGAMNNAYKKFMVLVGTYLVIQELSRYYFLRNVGAHDALTPVLFTIIVAGTYMIGIALGRLLLYASAIYLSHKRSKRNDNAST